jgi:hypothetical protein
MEPSRSIGRQLSLRHLDRRDGSGGSNIVQTMFARPALTAWQGVGAPPLTMTAERN